MRELVRTAISEQPDIEIVGEVEHDPDIPNAIAETRPDFLIITLEKSDERPEICDAILHKHPQLKILALAPERNSTIFYWAALDIHSNRVETSEEGILKALRGKTEVERGLS